ncbi:protein-disulfide reductase DsbD family protein [Sphingomonas naphthae]|uniref:Protein-disulfide reductase DsbD family protein n=1 Tax=Sphingomonas naphthae TaxID=1813468 RepID=A0ABY7TRZ4_9SPHN|nr:protein-disulfide reductase DsbD domain-containing protein [Sphingomonas naphthae]WCT75461.1 protein-disulfide reductase DsbD family protein [Sphingomonas naphthae]
MHCFRFVTLFLAILGLAPAWAAGPHIKPTLVAEHATPAPGSTVSLALVMKAEPGWHGYWKNPGDSGVETSIAWTLPKGVTAGPLQYPVPHPLLISGLMNYVYEGDYAQPIALTLPRALTVGTLLPLRGKVDWLECTQEICVPASAEVALDLIVGTGAPSAAAVAQFDGYRAALPKPLGSPATFQIENGRIRISVPLPASASVADPYFFPLTDGAIDYAAPQTATRDGDRLVIETKAGPDAALKTIAGVLRVGEGQGLELTATPGTVPAGGTPLGEGAAAGEGGMAVTILLALGGAILGGLLLNIMPCVFPILSLKAMSLVRQGESERGARIEALAYAAGVILVCVALGGALLALRAAGATAGWAFQLQDARVILVLLLLVAAIALNLAGLFELPTFSAGGRLAAADGAGGAFWTGALAAFVATPCTGPFMGAALGAALVLPAAAAIAIFAGLGLGLALPFLALGFIPALRRRLPKPGAWMNTFRHILSIPMFLTAVGLAWILGRQAGVDGMTLGLAAALLLALGLWWVGRRQQGGKGGAWWPALPAAALALAALAIVPKAPAEAAKADVAMGTEPFSEARLAALRAEGRPVFAYFTADWCLTCKVNEKTSIERADVADSFKAKNVAVLVGDWTSGDATIGRFLASHGRSGVPLYLYYPAGGGEPKVLPQVLTPGALTSLN